MPKRNESSVPAAYNMYASVVFFFFLSLSFKLSLVSTDTVPFLKQGFVDHKWGEGGRGVTGVPFLECCCRSRGSRWWSHQVSLGVTFLSRI